ncbi:unnamed protein product [Calypogeia fissa]
MAPKSRHSRLISPCRAKSCDNLSDREESASKVLWCEGLLSLDSELYLRRQPSKRSSGPFWRLGFRA